jgi:hypothetical protein
MGKKSKSRSKRQPKAKYKEAVKDNDLPNELRRTVGRAFLSGWVQNSGIGFLLALLALIIAMTTSSQVKVAALTSAGVGTLFLWILAAAIIKYASEPKETEYTGLLLPGTAATPANPCEPIPADAMTILLGRSASYTSQFPHTVLRIRGQDVLTMDRQGGRIAISARVFSRDGRIVADIAQNEFHINPNNYFRKERPRPQTLRVFDQENRKVLDVDFLNPRAIRFSGIFDHPRGAVVISDTAGLFRNSLCFGNNQTDVNVD